MDAQTTASSPETLSARLKGVLRLMPAPVGIVTSINDKNDPVGLAVSALMPVSLDPCLMAISINRNGSSYSHMIDSGEFCINLLNCEMSGELSIFSDYKTRDQRFKSSSWKTHQRLWYFDGAPASLFCKIASALSFGTHDVIVGEMFDIIQSNDIEILGWADGSLGTLTKIR